MKISTALLLLSLVAVAVLAPAAYPQKLSDKQMIELIMRDVLDMKNAFTQFQETLDKKLADKSAGSEKLAGQAIDETRSLGLSIQKLNDTIAGLKTEYSKSSGDLQKELRTQLTPVAASFKEIHETLVSMQRQYDSLAAEVKAMKNQPQSLPEAREIYNLAMGDYLGGQYSLSITGFREFLAQFGSDPRAASAQFQIAEAEFALRKFAEAETDYDLALQKYPDFDKKCTALWKKGQTQYELKSPSTKATLTEVGKACPGTPEATNAADLSKRVPR